LEWYAGVIYNRVGLNLAGVLFLVLAAQEFAVSGSIVGSQHDLSSGWAGGGSDEICVFCHTPHNANPDVDNDGAADIDHATRPSAPLWNRRISTVAHYQVYASATLNMTCDNTPSPLSLVCLSCHDVATSFTGVDGAVDASDGNNDTHILVNEPNRGDTNGNCATRCHPSGGDEPPKWFQIGPDLSNDHPVSMTYPTASQDPGFFPPDDEQTGWNDVKLFRGRVECPSCHNPHDPDNVPFLRKSMVGSGLCFRCHDK